MTTSTAARVGAAGGRLSHPLAPIKEQHMPTNPQPADGYQLDKEYAINVDEDGRPFARVLFAFQPSVPGEKRITLVHGITEAVDGARFGAEVAEVQQPSDRAAVERVRAVLETEAVVGRSALDYRGLITTALMADEAPANIQCPDGFWTKQPHAPHDWQQEPDAAAVHCPGVDGEAQQAEEQADDGPPAPLRRAWDDCPGFPEQCPNLRPVDPDPPTHLGGIRCGCADKEPTQ